MTAAKLLSSSPYRRRHMIKKNSRDFYSDALPENIISAWSQLLYWSLPSLTVHVLVLLHTTNHKFCRALDSNNSFECIEKVDVTEIELGSK